MYPSQTRSVVSLASLYSVRMLGLFMVLPVLTLEMDEYPGSSIYLLGIALGVYGLTQALLQIPFGLLSDRFGRKPLILIGLILFALGSVLAATAESITGLIIGRALQGAGAIAGVVMAMVGDLIREEHRSKAMASIGASIGVAFALSLVIGPFVAALGGVRWIFWLTVVLSLIGVLLVLFVVPTPASIQNQRARHHVSVGEDLKVILCNAKLLRLNAGIFILHAVLMALFVVLPLMLSDFGILQTQHSWVYLGVMSGSFCFMVPFMVIGERIKKVRIFFLSMIALSASALIAMQVIVTGPYPMIAAMLLFFTGFNYLEATLPSLMSKTVPVAQRGSGSSLFASCQFLGAACGGFAGGYLFELKGAAGVLLLAAIVMLIWWLLVAISRDEEKSAS